MIANEIEKTQQIWYGCYDGGWQNLIQPEAYAHPAKFSRNLISRIYSYALERGWLKAGDTALDPFGGVGLGALDAGANGLNYIGVELESRFHDMGQGCDCTGISKADWVRFYGRWDKVAHKDGRHWCPQCLAEAKQVTIDQGQLSFFEPEPTAAYTRNSGIIPETKPHPYTGNLELFRKYAQPGTFAILLNGDSRRLRSVIGQGIAEGLLSSPPYASLDTKGGRNGGTQVGGRHKESPTLKENSAAGSGLGYGASDGQLGGMSEGSLADSLLSSPPYAHPAKTGEAKEDSWADGRSRPVGASQRNNNGYGHTEGQLGEMTTGNLADSLLSSPPFAGNTGGRGEASRNGIDAALFDRHSGGMKKGTGDNPANLDHLPMKGFGEALVSSPPFEGSLNDGLSENDRLKYKELTRCGKGVGTNYGTTPGQLGTEQGTTFWAAAKQIVSESYLALKPGSYSFWVCKKFVRDGCIVDFPGQWQQLCEAVGFEYVETIRAMLVSRENGQGEIDGGVKKIQKQKKSFFRRLAERNGSPAIDYEEVVVMRKPL